MTVHPHLFHVTSERNSGSEMKHLETVRMLSAKKEWHILDRILPLLLSSSLFRYMAVIPLRGRYDGVVLQLFFLLVATPLLACIVNSAGCGL